MDLWRGEAYTKYFDHLEASGGFYYEVCVFQPDYLDSGLTEIDLFSAGETP